VNNQSQLKKRLLEIRSNNWNIPDGINKRQFALELMDNIGSTDPVLRDDLILSMLWKMIVDKVLSQEEIKELLEVSLSDKHLFYKVGEKEDDSVFNRAFTVLIIRLIMYYQNNYGEDLLSEEELIRVFNDFIKYVRQERDLRGYDKDKGWAHAIAHSGDALRTFAYCKYIGHVQLIEILEVIKEKVDVSYYVYINEECERLVSAVINVIERNELSEEEIISWIRSFEELEKPDKFPEEHYWRENVKNLLRSLYFRLKFRKGSDKIINEIEKVLHNINDSYTVLCNYE
jgi:hypothetical protein